MFLSKDASILSVIFTEPQQDGNGITQAKERSALHQYLWKDRDGFNFWEPKDKFEKL